MTMHHVLLAALLAASNPAAPAQAPQTAAEAAMKAYWDRLPNQLRTSESARERALGARFKAPEDPVGTGKALREAAQAAPTDALVQMIWATVGDRWSGCAAIESCPEQSLAWSRVEPDNGLAWVPVFEAMGKKGDARSIDADIARMAAARYYDDHYIDYWMAWRKAISTG